MFIFFRFRVHIGFVVLKKWRILCIKNLPRFRSRKIKKKLQKKNGSPTFNLFLRASNRGEPFSLGWVLGLTVYFSLATGYLFYYAQDFKVYQCAKVPNRPRTQSVLFISVGLLVSSPIRGDHCESGLFYIRSRPILKQLH